MTDKSNLFGQIHGNLRKRVLFVITQSEYGGAQRFMDSLVSNLNRDGFEVLVAIGATGNGDLLKILNSKNIPTRQLKRLKRKPSLNDLAAIFEIRRLIKEYKPDTLFLNSSKAGFIGSLAAVTPTRLSNLKVIYRIGGWSFNDPQPVLRSWLLIILEWLSARWKDIIIVNNQHDFDQALKLKIKPRRNLALVHNGLDIYKLDLLPTEDARLKLFEKAVRSAGKIFQVKTIIGCIANFYPAKGLDTLIEAARDFRDDDDLIFLIIGDGEMRDKLEQQIKEQGLKRRVILLGQLPDAQRYLSAFSLFVLPSHKEGFPWVLIEAMSAKLPVIATRVGAVPEIIENRKNGLVVEPKNSQQLSAAIREVLNNERFGSELAIQAHQTVLFKFRLDDMVKKIEGLI